MKINILAVMLLNSLLFASSVMADQASDSLGGCMVDSLTGKERKQLATWIFLAMSLHPDIEKISNVPDASRKETDQTIGALITRLLVQDCPTQAKLAMKKDSGLAMRKAFELVGAVAMQELMTNEKVTNSISGFEKYLDKDKINSLISSK